MQIQFKGSNYDLADDITDFATKKLEGLQKYLGKKEHPVLVYADLGKLSEAHQTGDIWFMEINLDREGRRFNVKASANSLRSAVDRAIGDMSRELKVVKTKEAGMLKRGGARLKELLRFGQ